MSADTSTTAWWAERYLSLFDQSIIEPNLERASDTVRRRKSIDFRMESGGARVRLHDSQRRPVTAILQIEKLTDEDWRKVAEIIATKAVYASQLLAGRLNENLATECLERGVDLFPTEAISVSVNADEQAERDLFLTVLYVMLGDAIELDPFNVFRLRGIEKEEILYQVREARRSLIADEQETREEESHARPRIEAINPEPETFWSLGESVSELTYNLKADELPASLLRRLDAIPLGDVSHDAEIALEEAYAHIASRAQAYGLGLS